MIPGLVKDFRPGFVQGDQGIDIVPDPDGTGKLWLCEGDWAGNGSGWVLIYVHGDDGELVSSHFIGGADRALSWAKAEAKQWAEQNA